MDGFLQLLTRMLPYLLSGDLDYSKMIVPDAGPVYARRMGWAPVAFSNRALLAEPAVIVDPRLSERECALMTEHIAQHPETRFAFRVIDPYREHCDQHWYYHFLTKVAARMNTLLITPYEPAAVVKQLAMRFHHDRTLVLPYPYLASLEQRGGVPAEGRSPQIMSCGARNAAIYPARDLFDRAVRFSPLRFKVWKLEHPGYPDIGQRQRHHVVGDVYLSHLSRFRFMFTCGSRHKLEFLKYGEAAAAGCVPIGDAALGMPDEARRAFVPLSFDSPATLRKSIRATLAMPESEVKERATAYRESYRAERNTRRLNATLREFLSAHGAAAASGGSALTSPASSA